MGRDKSILSLISLTKKSGNLKSGEEMVIEAIRLGGSHLVIVAGDASENTIKKFRDKADYYEVPLIQISTKEALGRAIGKDYCASIAIMDGGLAKAITKKYEALKIDS